MRANLIEKIESLPKFELKEIQTIEGKRIKDFRAVQEVNGEVVAIVSKDYKLVQFKEVFLPLALSFNYVDGGVYYFRGKALLEMWNSEGIGILAKNSVDKSTAIHIKYFVRHWVDNKCYEFILRGFRRIHIGKADRDLRLVMKAIKKVGKIWEKLLNKLKEKEIDLKEIEEYIKLPKKLREEIEARIQWKKAKGEVYTYYDFWIDSIEYYRKKRYKSEIHRTEKIEKVCDAIINILGAEMLELVLTWNANS